jgi:DNA-binding CsgD family transcriptional regulator
VAGERDLHMPDGPQMTIAYCAAANMLPGVHLLVFAPASWPEDELGGLIDERPPAPAGALTARERDVLALVATGADIREIAGDLSLSPNTVKTHLRNAMRRIGARNRAHAIALALRSGEIT